ncbi:MAG TPA: ABC transporter permease, partial [Firmicutes bacterium]|nr:ABC transporter permease [Bacillota bacterium]
MYRRRITWLLVPALLLLGFFFLWPLAGMFLSTVYQAETGLAPVAGYGRFFADPFNRLVFWRTLKLGLLVTGLAVVAGYPVAFLLSRLEGRLKSVLMALVVFPLLTNAVVRTFSWMVVLGKHGFVNEALQWLHLTDGPVKL